MTEKVLNDGMCGGPATIEDTTNVCGMIEGIVSQDHEVANLQGMAVIVDDLVIAEYEFIL